SRSLGRLDRLVERRNRLREADCASPRAGEYCSAWLHALACAMLRTPFVAVRARPVAVVRLALIASDMANAASACVAADVFSSMAPPPPPRPLRCESSPFETPLGGPR